ncbi:MAG: hypothetical protein HYV90_02485 [Candidatus Woesebacteria bacterium]|nr:MAG: hypothetical protein HYV90_02485 [Candidatus Woesebacteria bacterium]
MNERFRVNLFDCTNCGTTKIYAFLHECPGCGTPNPGQGHWYPGPYVTDIKMLQLAAKEPFWKCSHCEGSNFGEDKSKGCQHCGHEYDPSDISAKVIPGGTSQTNAPRRPAVHDSSYYVPADLPSPKVVHSSPSYQRSMVSSLPSYKSSGRSGLRLDGQTLGIAAVILVIVALLGAFLFAKFHTTAHNAEFTGPSWTRSFDVQRFEVVHESDSTSNPPASAYNIDSWVTTEKKEVTRSEEYTVPKTCHHSEDLGNGFTREWDEDCSYTATRQVFDHYDYIDTTHYSYDHNEWVFYRTISESRDNFEPFWPAYNLNLEGQTVLGAERAVNYRETYTLKFDWYDKDETKFTAIYKVSEAEWHQYVVGEYYPIEVNSLGEVRNNPLQDKLNPPE